MKGVLLMGKSLPSNHTLTSGSIISIMLPGLYPEKILVRKCPGLNSLPRYLAGFTFPLGKEKYEQGKHH